MFALKCLGPGLFIKYVSDGKGGIENCSKFTDEGVKNFWHVPVVSKPKKKRHLWMIPTLECTWRSKGQAVPRAERPNQCNALDKLKRCGQWSSNVCRIPSCTYEKAFDTKQSWRNLGGKGAFPPSQIFADQLTLFQPWGPYFHTFRRLCALF